MRYSPIVLFVYNRPEHTRKTLEALMANQLADQSELFIYADGPKSEASASVLTAIAETRRVIREKQWCGKVHIIESDKNKGLADSVIEGVTQVVNEYDRIIVLEDDLITSRGFLAYMNDGLQLYETVANVYSINGYMFPISYKGTESTVLLPYISTWGWATWKKKWEIFDRNAKDNEYIINSYELQKRFNIADYNYTSILKDHSKTSWGIRWYYSIFLKNGLSIFPTKTLVSNTGFDGSGTHCDDSTRSGDILTDSLIIKQVSSINLPFYTSFLDYFTNKERINNPKVNRINKILKYFM